MGFASAFSGKAGGFWNHVDVTFKGYKFTTKSPGSDRRDIVYFVPTVRVDGQEEDTSRHMMVGQVERFEISEDGKTLTPTEGNRLRFNKEGKKGIIEFAAFMESLVLEAEFPEDRLPDLDAKKPVLNLAALVGERFHFEQRVDEVGTKERGKRPNKDGKPTYDQTYTVVTDYYGRQDGKTAGAAAGKANGKANGKAGDGAAENLAVQGLKDVLEAKGPLKIAKAITHVQLAIGKNSLKDEALAFLRDNENLVNIEGLVFDPDTQIVALEG